MAKVLKFGGTSVGTVDAIRRCIVIIGSAPQGSVAVFSAFSGVTDLLSDAADCAVTDFQRASENVEKIKSRSMSIAKELISDSTILEQAIHEVELLIDEIRELIESINYLRECFPVAKDSVLAKGELISSKILHYALISSEINSLFADARDFIVTDNHYGYAKPDYDAIIGKIKEQLCDKLSRGGYSVAVTQGYIGRSYENKTSTLGRGGSDFSASIIGASLKSAGHPIECIEIYTDVNGVMTADPKLVPGAKSLKQVSVSEMLEMSYYGAKVLHPATVLPALESNIPVRILNTLNGNFPGTIITAALESKVMKFRTVVQLNNIYYFTIKNDSISRIISNVNELTSRILASGSLLLHSSVNAYSAIIIAKVPDETVLMVLSESGAKPLKVNAAAITGENIRLCRELTAKLNILMDDIDTNELLFGILCASGNSVLLGSEYDLDIRQIHDVFINLQIA